MLVDIHQHIWTRALLEALAERSELPYVRQEHGLTIVYSDGEPPFVVDVEGEAPERRAELVAQDGLDAAVIAISSPIGIEALPRAQALSLIEAHLDGVQALPREFAAWGPVAIDGAEADEVDNLLDRGCVGVSVPAGALAGPTRLEQLGAVLERAAQRGAPVLVHPGRAPGQRPIPYELDEPLWWRPLTDYVSQMQAAWLTFAAVGRRDHPELKIVFAMLAGGAPLVSERLYARGGPAVELDDPGIFYETSSYGPAAVEMAAGLVGKGQLVYGSDRPVVEPVAGVRDHVLQSNAGDLIAKVRV